MIMIMIMIMKCEFIVTLAMINTTSMIVIQCHFAYMGTPACKDCDGKRVYKSIDCQQRYVVI